VGLTCDEAELSLRTYRRRYRPCRIGMNRRPLASRPVPANKIREQETQVILAVSNELQYASLPPSQLVPTLLDEGIYLASEPSFYHILKAHNQLHHRGRSKAPTKRGKPTSHTASGLNQLWSWDITYLASRVKGQFYYLYLFEDIYSRDLLSINSRASCLNVTNLA
jgi:putative transposase